MTLSSEETRESEPVVAVVEVVEVVEEDRFLFVLVVLVSGLYQELGPAVEILKDHEDLNER